MKKLVLLLMVAACSFRPVFTSGKTDIYVGQISGINGIELRNSLNAKFGASYAEDAKYNLSVDLSEPITKYKAFERAGDAEWQEVKLVANYVLKQDGKEIARGTESATESYTFVRYLVAANASYNNAVANTVYQLADKISLRVISEIQKQDKK